MIQLHDHGANRNTMRGSSVLDDDPRRGLVTSVNNNQTQMALRYALIVLADLDQKIDSLMSARAENDSHTVPDAKRKTPSKKAEEESATS